VSKIPIEFAIGQALPVSPTSTPKPTPAPSKKPVTDGCKYQIKN